MFGFVDETTIEVSSGSGGAGAVSFRREKYVPKGGPDGGDGGKGGDIVFVVKGNLKTLSDLKRRHHFRAENGEPGKGRKKHGRDGESIHIFVPPGTVVRDCESGTILKDLTEGKWVFLRGGRGGLGNSHFSTSRRQAPRFAQPGEPGISTALRIELNLIADVGLVGYPNAGKSTLLSVLTNARPKIGDWAFTTKIPNLGVLRHGERELVLADIPGIIEGASHGAGLGIQFLKHIARTSALLLLIDLCEPVPEKSFGVLIREVGTFSATLAGRPRLVVGTKTDVSGTEGNLMRLRSELPNERVIGVSAVTRAGLDELVDAMCDVAG